MSNEMNSKALGGVRVLELCARVSGPYCTKLMADMGAEVIKIEQPGQGDEARRMPPFPGDVPHPEKSGLFLYLNSNKLGITLDPQKEAGKRIFLDLVRNTDVLVEDRPVGEMENLGLGYEALRQINPGLVMASITPFGRSGPYKDYKAYELNLAHVGGQGFLLPLPSPDLSRPPVKSGGHASDVDAALVAVVPILAAVFWKGATGQGQFVEISKQEALLSMQRVEAVTFPNDGVVMTRRGHMQGGRTPDGIMPCSDGYVVTITPEEHQWQALMELLGNPEWSKQEWCKDRATRSEHAEKIANLIAEWMRQHTKEEIFRKGQALSVPVSPVYSAEDVANSEQYTARQFFVDIEHPALGTIKFPSAAYRFSETPWRIERPAPLLGQHNEDVLCRRLGYSQHDLDQLKAAGVV